MILLPIFQLQKEWFFYDIVILVILPNLSGVLGEKESAHYQFRTTIYQIKVFRIKEDKVLLGQIPTTKLQDHLAEKE